MSSDIRHIGIVVNDLTKSIEFWQKYFRFEIAIDQIEPSPYIDELLNLKTEKLQTVKLKGKNQVLIELLKFHNLKIEEMWSGTLTSTGLTHIALIVDNLEDLCDKLVEDGYQTISKILIPPSKKVKVVFIKGPENLLIELVEEITN